MNYEIPIPHCYLFITEGMSNRKERFYKYVKGYLKQSYPDLELVDIKGMTAICKRRG